MAYQQHPSRTHRYSSGRESHTHAGSRSATLSTPEPTQSRTSVDAASTSRYRDFGASRRSHRQTVFDDDFGSDGEAYDYSSSRDGQHISQEGHQDRYELYRSWRSHNSELDRVVENPTLNEAIDKLGGRVSRHNRSSSRQTRPTPTHRNRSPGQDQSNSRPLGYSNLRNLNERRSPQHPMERRFREDQQSGPYDSVSSVGRQSDYDRRERYASYDPNAGYARRYEEEEYDLWYDDRRSDNDY